MCFLSRDRATLRQLRLRVSWARAYASSMLWVKPVLDPIVVRGVTVPSPGPGFRAVLPTSYNDTDLVVGEARRCASSFVCPAFLFLRSLVGLCECLVW